MTVCVATICDGGMIVCASDRMLTAGDIQFQPPTRKIFVATTSIVVMVSGDMSLQSELLGRLDDRIRHLLDAEPKPDWFELGDVASWYAEFFHDVSLRRAEAEYLLPLGLTHESFLSKQSTLQHSLVDKLSTELINFRIPAVSAIIAGVDKKGAHLYRVMNGNITCHDAVGFVAIGAGANHANSYLMFSGHSRHGTFPRTMLLTFTAKKRAEVAPGVGAETDMVAFGSNLGWYVEIGTEVTQKFSEFYAESVKGHAEVEQRSEASAHEYIDEILRRTSGGSQQAAPEVVDEAPSNDETSAPDGTG